MLHRGFALNGPESPNVNLHARTGIKMYAPDKFGTRTKLLVITLKLLKFWHWNLPIGTNLLLIWDPRVTLHMCQPPNLGPQIAWF